MSKKANKPNEPLAPAENSGAVAVAAPKTARKPLPVEKTVRFISVNAELHVVVNPPYEETVTVGGKTRTQRYEGDFVQFKGNYAEVPEDLVEPFRTLPGYGIKYLELDELRRMQESDDNLERRDAERFLKLADKHRAIQNKPSLTKKVLAI